MKKIMLFAVTASAFLGSTAQSLKPGIKLTKGQQYEITTAMNATIQQMGMEMPVETATTLLVTVLEENANGFLVNAKTKHFVMKSNVMGQDMNFDSDKKADMDGEMGERFKAMIERIDSFTVDKNGLAKKLREQPVKTDESKGSDMMSMMTGGKAGSIPAIFNILPAKELKVGENVTEPSETKDAEGTEKSSNTYTIAEITNASAKVNYTGTNDVEKTVNINAMGQSITAETKTKISSKGEIWIDLASGLLTKKTSKAETEGTVTAMGQEIPVAGTSTTSVTVKKL